MARELGRFIASGLTADVHEWRPGWVLKLFREGIDSAVIRHEHGIAAAICKAGAPAPKTGGIVSIGPRYGIEYERIEGVPLPHAMRADPSKLYYYADLMADTQLQVNSIENVEGVPLQRMTFEQRLSVENILDSETKRRVLARMDELATGSSLCHGDYHPENIILHEGKATVLDPCKLRRSLWRCGTNRRHFERVFGHDTGALGRGDSPSPIHPAILGPVSAIGPSLCGEIS